MARHHLVFKEILNIGSYLKRPNKVLAEAFSAIEFENFKEAQSLAKASHESHA
ncbi:MAG: hypothetical protein H6925_01185 [Holosporaceae bacterium]|nr:MAG: hypothetical protein H6925_01185 [Holosporaceae bacterium]